MNYLLLKAQRLATTKTEFRDQVRGMGIEEVPSAPRSSWQRAYVERIIGSIRRECLDHVFDLRNVLHISVLARDTSALRPSTMSA
jgi:transposase InsO family protein